MRASLERSSLKVAKIRLHNRKNHDNDWLKPDP